MNILSEYEPVALFENWFELLRTTEELGNIPMELSSFFDYMMLSFDLSDEQAFKDIKNEINEKYSPAISERFSNIFMMCAKSNFQTISEAVEYFQSKRTHFAATLFLIPHLCKGEKKITFTEILNELVFPLGNIPVAYSSLLWDTLYDQGTFSEPDYYDGEYQQLPAGKVHSFINIENTLLQFSTANAKYDIADDKIYQQVQTLTKELKQYCEDDFTITVPIAAFEIIAKDLMPFLVLTNSDYYNAINSPAAFVIMNGYAKTSVTLLTAFINQLHAKVLSRSKKFQIASAALFEKKTADILTENGFTITDTTHINQKEFYLITNKNNITYTFHCKNNPIDVVKVDSDHKKITRLNTLRIKHYEKALEKEHFVISRFPVITSVPGIVNFTGLDEFLQSV